MGKKPEKLDAFMKRYKIADDEVWQPRPNSSWAIVHSALERVAAENNIVFGPPLIAEKDSVNKIVAVLVTAKMGDREEWSFGEAAPANNKNAYCYAMAEKRGKDRCILKLLNAHGHVYSWEELRDAPDIGDKRPNPHGTKPSEIVDTPDYDEHGNPIENIPYGDEGIEPMNKALSRKYYAELQAELHKIKTAPELLGWANSVKNRVATLHPEFQDYLRGQTKEYLKEIRNPQTEAAQ
jgi:hypothetical protein